MLSFHNDPKLKQTILEQPEVYDKWAVRMLKRVRVYALDDGKEAIDRVIGLLEKGGNVDDARIVSDAAYAAADAADRDCNPRAADAAYAACYAIAYKTGYNVVASFDYAAGYAAYVAADSHDTNTNAYCTEIIKQRDDLIELLREVGNE